MPPPEAIGSPGPELLWTKLAAPAPRPGLLPRTDLQEQLQKGLEAKLCLLDAPAGSGKTTLLAQWSATAGAGRVAWVSLDEGDNDPTRFWVYVVEALRTVEPGVGAAALDALRRPSADLYRAVLPGLLNQLSAAGSPLFLVLDDYHLITNSACHQILGYFLDHLPAGVHVALAGRTDPPLPLARMRARGELAEIRVAELQFTGEEAMALLNGEMGLQLAADDVERLAERTEGWAAGLYLAGLSLRGRKDSSAFVAAFQGDNRHIADYLGAEVLASQPDTIRAFLLRTSILERLSGPFCDAVLEAQGSARLLEELECSNLFLVPLDHRREWYRYHHLFAQLLRLELAAGEPALVATLHRRAAAWHRQAGNLDAAIGHASAAGQFDEAAALIARHWLTYWRRGQRATRGPLVGWAARGGHHGQPAGGLRRRLDPRVQRRLQAGIRALAGRAGRPQLGGSAAGRRQLAGVRRQPGPGRAVTVVMTFALIALSALASRLRQPGLARPYRMPLWPLTPVVALAGVAVTVSLQTGRDLAIVAGILAAGLAYESVYLRPRRDTHWILLEPPAGERDVGHN